jgi:hypothetical protein
VLNFRVEGGRLVATTAAQRDPAEAVYGILGAPASTGEVVAALRGEPDGV